MAVNITEVFRHEFFSEEIVGTTTIYSKDVALLKLDRPIDIDQYPTVILPDPNSDYRGKQTTYHGETTFTCEFIMQLTIYRQLSYYYVLLNNCYSS